MINSVIFVTEVKVVITIICDVSQGNLLRESLLPHSDLPQSYRFLLQPHTLGYNTLKPGRHQR